MMLQVGEFENAKVFPLDSFGVNQETCNYCKKLVLDNYDKPKLFPIIITVVGPKNSGKTSLIHSLFGGKKMSYVFFEKDNFNDLVKKIYSYDFSEYDLCYWHHSDWSVVTEKDAYYFFKSIKGIHIFEFDSEEYPPILKKISTLFIELPGLGAELKTDQNQKDDDLIEQKNEPRSLKSDVMKKMVTVVSFKQKLFNCIATSKRWVVRNWKNILIILLIIIACYNGYTTYKWKRLVGTYWVRTVNNWCFECEHCKTNNLIDE